MLAFLLKLAALLSALAGSAITALMLAACVLGRTSPTEDQWGWVRLFGLISLGLWVLFVALAFF
jgi:energy-converting hydrogenase Eha subunit A